MRFIIICLATVTLILACNTGKKNLLSKPVDIAGNKYVITIDKDTVDKARSFAENTQRLNTNRRERGK